MEYKRLLFLAIYNHKFTSDEVTQEGIQSIINSIEDDTAKFYANKIEDTSFIN